MLSVAKIAPGQERYYLDQVARGIEDYYSGLGESPGRWTGSAIAHLGLSGEVGGRALEAILDGRDPRTGTRLTQTRKDRVPGFDLTFSAPKSVSVLWGLGDPDTAREVRAAHDAAVDAALGWLEREGCRSRRGVDGHEVVAVDGFIAAAFVHRTSRAGDPQLHTHVLVANLAHCEDGKWRALDGKALLWQSRTAGHLYKAHLRHELTHRLGVDWEPVHKGAAEIVGIPSELCELFSTRRREIEDELAARGLHSPQAARTAALDTRRAKDHGVGADELRAQWQARAHDAGHDATAVHAALGQTTPIPVDDQARQRGTGTLLGAEGLTHRSSVFDRRDVLRGWCEQLPQGAPITTIERFADATLRDGRVVALTESNPYPKCSTTELVALEQRLATRAFAGVGTGHGAVAEPVLRAALDARPALSPEQVAVVAQITTSGNSVDVLVAAAGTGKTFCLDAAHDAWTRAGHRVLGASLAATAAAQLQAQTAIPSDTLALRALQLADGTLQLDDRTAVVVDEAAMVGTRQLAVLLDAAAAARAKVVLVGDPKQLSAIDAGGLLSGLALRLPTVTLEENRRQQEAWERDALTRLRRGGIEEALAAYDAHDRIVTAPTAIGLRNRIAADWNAATLAGEKVVMLAERRHDVDDLNQRARHWRSAAGALRGPELDIDGRAFQAGDRVLCLRNDRRLGVHNGTLATVTAVDIERRAVTIRTDSGSAHELPARYLDAGHLTHGYAMTIHKSQGLTVDRCLVLATDTLDHNAGYTALSRGKAENRIYLHGALPNPEAHHVDRSVPDPREGLEASLSRDRSDRLAIDHLGPAALRHELQHLYRDRAHLLPVRDAMPPDLSTDIAALTQERAELEKRHARAQRQLEQVRPGFRHRHERLAQRLSAERSLDQTATGLDRVDAALATAAARQQEREQYVREHRPELDRLAAIETRIDQRLDVLVDALTTRPPEHLTPLGDVPSTEYGQQCWRDSARAVEAYRIAHSVTARDTMLGGLPNDLDAADAWRSTTFQLRQLRHAFTPHQSQEQALDRERGHSLSL